MINMFLLWLFGIRVKKQKEGKDKKFYRGRVKNGADNPADELAQREQSHSLLF